MDIKSSIDSFVKDIDENAKKVFSSLAKDNEGNRSPQQNFTPVKIKEEETGDEIQEYAATTMSELLGWYGYDKVDSGCTRSLNLDHFTSTSSTKDNQVPQTNQNITSNKLALKNSILPDTSSLSPEVSSLSLPCSTTVNKRLSPPVELKFDPTSTSKFPYKHYTNSICSDDKITCSECGRMIKTHASEETNSLSYSTINTLNNLGYFCSEACLIAGRRAVFKQAKACDWCRHMRNPISYVGFQDDESQLQFCSDRCLNQYKINIFCHEIQTHLMLQGINNVSFHDTEKGSLITPELWFRNCQSPQNNATKDTFVVDNNLIYKSSSPFPDNKPKEMQNNNEKLESDPKVSRKKDSICIKKHIKTNSYNEKKNNFYREINENNVDKYIKEQTLANEENKFCYFIGNQNHYNVNCSQRNDLNYKTFKKNCNLMDIINYNSCNHQQNDGMILGKNVHVKDIQSLQEEKDHNSLEDKLRSSPCLSRSTRSLIQCKVTPLSKACMHKFSQTINQDQVSISPRTSTPIQSNQVDFPVNSTATALLPSVTVLAPYPLPIPIPIPIPIPVPIPTPISDNFITDKQEDITSTEDSDHKHVKCQNLLENKYLAPNMSQLDANEIVTVTKGLQYTIPKSMINNKNNDKLPQLKYNAKSLRKRKHSSEIINDKHKKVQPKRKKFIAV